VREKSRKLSIVESARDFTSHQPATAWLNVDREGLKATVTAVPKREDINMPVNEQLIVELYSK